MSTKYLSLIFLTVLYNLTTFASEIQFRKATRNDAVNLIHLVESYTQEDKEKVYVVPKLFRLEKILSDIENAYTFVAHDTQNNRILGYKNVFLLDTQKKLETVFEEMGCTGHHTQHIDTAQFTSTNLYKTRQIVSAYDTSFNKNNTHIYIDMDFTHPDLRGQGINKKLAEIGFDAMKEAIIQHIKKNNSEKLVLLYGLTYRNDYTDSNDGRTPGIVHSYAAFIKNNIAQSDNTLTIKHDRYVTGMPIYDENSTKNEPLPMDKWIKATGNALTYHLK